MERILVVDGVGYRFEAWKNKYQMEDFYISAGFYRYIAYGIVAATDLLSGYLL